MELFDDHSKSRLSGIRLERLEIQNWGTFDKDIFVLNFDGEPALLVGQNGTGKTTISDAILTLLVENNRNYNVSASSYGSRKGRNETSYIKGAFKEVSQDGQIQSTPAYLRTEEGTLSVLLAVFKHFTSGKSLSVAQIMYMSGGERKRLYFYRESEASIRDDLSNFEELRSIKPELKRRGFSVTDTVRAYFEKIRRWCGMRPKALDVFNQTVAVKEIENLNSFIRSYMLDAKDYEPQVQEITSHYRDLDTAYQQIIHSEAQLKYLSPIESQGKDYENAKDATNDLKAQEKVRAFFFAQRQEEIFSTAIKDAKAEIDSNKVAREEKEAEESKLNQRIIALEVEKTQKGGILKELEGDLKEHTRRQLECNARLRDYNRALEELDIEERPTDHKTFNSISKRVRAINEKAPQEAENARNESLKCAARLESLREKKDEDETHLAELQGSKSNLDPNLRELRQQICEALSIDPTRMPFAAELIQVKDEETEWQLAIELVLKAFGRTLLIPPELHASVVEYAERNKLKNKVGKGMLLEYEKVDTNDQTGMRREAPSGKDFVANKLSYKLTHAFGAWVMREVRDRFPIKCIEDTDAFRAYHGRAVTLAGQIRFDNGRIRKDDRESSRDKRNFNLGWDNEQKREELARSINDARESIDKLEPQAATLAKRETFWRDVKHYGKTVLQIQLWSELDVASIQTRIDDLEQQITEFKEENADIAELDKRIGDAEKEQSSIKRKIENLTKASARLEEKIDGWTTSLTLAQRNKMLQSTPDPDQLEGVEAQLRNSYLMTVESVLNDDNKSREALNLKIIAAEKKENKLSSEIEKAMKGFLEAFQSDGFWQRLSPEIGYLVEFRKEYAKINGEGLPRHKEKFRTMARDRLYNDLGQLNHELRNAEKEMKERIGEINDALHDIEYNHRSYTRLRFVRANFQQRDKLQNYLKDALNNSLGGQRTYEEAQAFFKTIEPLIKDLTADDGWAKTACDVRNWYDFAADEKNMEDDSEIRTFRSTETSSGGEKAKLAFTILVAALVYQYDLDPGNPGEQKFRFAVIDEAFAKVDDVYATYVLELFERFGLQTMIVAPLDPKSLIVVPYMDYYVMTVKSICDDGKDRSRILTMTKELIEEKMLLAKRAKESEDTPA